MNEIKKTIKAVIFDMDGTIIKTEHIWKDAMREFLEARGIFSLTHEQQNLLKSFSGIGHKVASGLVKAEFNLQEDVDDLAHDLKQRATSRYAHSIDFVEGFEFFAKKLADHGVSVGLATNADGKSLQELSQKMNLHNFFGVHLYSISHVGDKAKPDPSVFLHTAKQLNILPEECLVFEDSIFGFMAAKAAGMRCIAIKTDFNEKHRDHAHHAIENYHEAEEAIRHLLKKNK